MSDLSYYDEAFEAGMRQARRDLAPLVEAINDTIFMFKDIEKARQIPGVHAQYIAMGKQLERLLKLSGLEP